MGWGNTPSPFRTGFRGECADCHAVSEAYTIREEALSHWNTRPAPPIGRCGECAAHVDNKCANDEYYKPSTGFCNDFVPKGGEENSYENND